MMRNTIHVMIKPAGGFCNLRCKYCFYADEMHKRKTESYGMMTEQTLEQIISKTLAEAKEQCFFVFQGGEPALAGISFFRRAIALAERYNVNRCAVEYALQTNATLLDDAWCRFFAENHFLIGVSLDGTKEIHDANRIDADGNGTYDRVVEGIRLLEKHKAEFNILTVLTGSCAGNFRKIYQQYENNGWHYQQYIPCLEPVGEKRGGHPWSLTPKRYAQYLRTAFDCWYWDAISGKKKYNRYFDNLLLRMDGQHPEACGMSGHCSIQYAVEADGSVYPCDFYMLDEYRLGNLNTDSYDELDRRRRELKFMEESLAVHPDCESCKWKALCRGGCRRDRDYFEEGMGKNCYCDAYREFFPYAWPRLQLLYRSLLAAIE